jgi:serine/threonine protein kinase
MGERVSAKSEYSSQPIHQHQHPQQHPTMRHHMPSNPAAAATAAVVVLPSGELAKDIAIMQMIGNGTGGTVFKAFHVPSYRIVAVKQVLVHDTVQRRQMRGELSAVLSGLSHPNIVKFLDSFTSAQDGTLSMVFEYMDAGSLQNIVDSGKALPLSLLSNVAFHCLRGLQYLHSHHYIHRDIKPSNLLISRDGCVKIADFGIARDLDSSAAVANTYLGTFMYMSPERVSGAEYSYNCDIWSLGLSLLACAFGCFPFDADSGYWGLARAIREQTIPTFPHSPKWGGFVQCIYSALKRDPSARPSAEQLLATAEMQHAATLEERRLAERAQKGLPLADGPEAREELSLLVELVRACKAEHRSSNQQLQPPDQGQVRNLASQLGLPQAAVYNSIGAPFVENNMARR